MKLKRKKNDTKAPAERVKAAAAEANRTPEEAEAQEIERRSMKSCSMVANRRGVSALSEHRRQDGWKSTPCTCSSSRQRRLRRDGRGATAETTPTPVRRKKTREKHIRQQQRKMKNILTAVMKSILVHDLHSRVKRQVLSCFTPAATRAK